MGIGIQGVDPGEPGQGGNPVVAQGQPPRVFRGGGGHLAVGAANIGQAEVGEGIRVVPGQGAGVQPFGLVDPAEMRGRQGGVVKDPGIGFRLRGQPVKSIGRLGPTLLLEVDHPSCKATSLSAGWKWNACR